MIVFNVLFEIFNIFVHRTIFSVSVPNLKNIRLALNPQLYKDFIGGIINLLPSLFSIRLNLISRGQMRLITLCNLSRTSSTSCSKLLLNIPILNVLLMLRFHVCVKRRIREIDLSTFRNRAFKASAFLVML